MNLIILRQNEFTTDKNICLTDERATHIIKILKGSVGDTLKIGFINGKIGSAEITSINQKSVRAKIMELREPEIKTPEIDIICALPRPQILKKVLTLAATTGVARLMLIRSNRVEKSYFDSVALEESRLERLLIEGLAQGMRTRLPEISVHKRFRAFWEDFFPEQHYPEDTLKLVAEPSSKLTLIEFYKSNVNRIVIAIGPEGGWNDFEFELMKKTGFKLYTLGDSILRVESACTAAIGQIEMLRISG